MGGSGDLILTADEIKDGEGSSFPTFMGLAGKSQAAIQGKQTENSLKSKINSVCSKFKRKKTSVQFLSLAVHFSV